ncbi:MerR family transcriptional regulator [Phycicoccus sp. HDW14]|nr:MerR family transcriptional regulator [Phycicoccus sp. HDW14]
MGVSTHVLRAWEARYNLLDPVRSPGGYRLYGTDDERRVREVLALREQGVSAMEAARQVLAAERAGAAAAMGALADGDGMLDGAEPARDTMRADPPVLVAQLLDAVTALDEDRAHAVLDTAFLDRSVESAIVDVLVPFFVRVGEMWELGRIGIAQEHFASSLVRRRLGALSLTWGIGTGPVAVLACPRASSTTSSCSASGCCSGGPAGASATSVPTPRSGRWPPPPTSPARTPWSSPRAGPPGSGPTRRPCAGSPRSTRCGSPAGAPPRASSRRSAPCTSAPTSSPTWGCSPPPPASVAGRARHPLRPRTPNDGRDARRRLCAGPSDPTASPDPRSST